MHAPAPVFRPDPRMSEGRFADVFCHLGLWLHPSGRC